MRDYATPGPDGAVQDLKYKDLFKGYHYEVSRADITPDPHWLFDVYKLENTETGEISYFVENMHDGIPGYSCGHSFSEFEQNVISYNEAAKNGTPKPLSFWYYDEPVNENLVVLEAANTRHRERIHFLQSIYLIIPENDAQQVIRVSQKHIHGIPLYTILPT